MKNKIVTMLLISVLVIMSCLPVYADSSLSYEVPDFEAYAESAGYDISKYPYYIIYAFENGGYLEFWCFWETSNFIQIENADKGTGSWSTLYYTGYHTIDNFVCCTVKTDMKGNYVSHSCTDSKNSGTLYKYFPVHAKYLYSNHDVIMKHTDGSVETVFMQAPFFEGHKVTIGTAISAQTLQQPLKKQILFLVPLVISLVVFSMGLRKALATLFRALRQA